MKTVYKNYKDFYQFYLSQHQNRWTRVFHFLGIIIILLVLFYVLQSSKQRFLWYIPIAGYGLPWLSHFLFEKKKPAAFRYPLWCFFADFQMFFELLTGKLKFKTEIPTAENASASSVEQSQK